MLTIKCLRCGQIWRLAESYAGQEVKCTCGYVFIIPDLAKHAQMSRQAAKEKKVNPARAAKTVSRLVERKKMSAFSEICIVDDKLREILYLQKAKASMQAETKLKGLLNKNELDSYYDPEKSDFELGVYFLHVYDKARVFYEREKKFQLAAVYAAMTIYARKINLKQIGLSGVDQKYLNALNKNLLKIGFKEKAQINQAISAAVKDTKTLNNRRSLLYQLKQILGAC